MPTIRRVGVLGAGVMGAAIAAHLANAGCEVLLLDRVPDTLGDEETARGLSLDNPAARNRFTTLGIEHALKAKPAAFFLPGYVDRITPGNFADDLPRLKECDWVLEAVVEHPGIKAQLLQSVAPHLRADAVLTTNTSGLSVSRLAETLPADLRPRFFATHFFNPPRYLRLVELVPHPATDPVRLAAMSDFLRRRLGKGVVTCKDTPNFIGNRIGLFSLLNAMHHMQELGLTIAEVDAVGGPATARPKSAVFRTADLVGLDTLAFVAQHSYELLPHDEARELYRVPAFLQTLLDAGRLGDKSGAGFYRKEQSADGKRIFAWDWRTGEYQPTVKPAFPCLAAAKQIPDAAGRLRAVLAGDDPGARFAWLTLRDTLIYAVNRVPEISSEIAGIDRAMRWGFGWELGPFEMLDAIGIDTFAARVEQDGVAVPAALRDMSTCYRVAGGSEEQFNPKERGYQPVLDAPGVIRLEIIRKSGGVVASKPACSLLDIGDGVFALEFHGKLNTIGADVLQMLPEALARAENEGVALVVGSQGAQFSAGADLMMLAFAMQMKQFAEIEKMVRAFQNATLALKCAQVPVVAAPYGLTLGGGCEFTMHATAALAHAETYMGLVEIGAGLLPAGGGTKELALRAVQTASAAGADVGPFILRAFRTIGLARVSTCADELFAMGLLRDGDRVCMDLDGQLGAAKSFALALAPTHRPARPATIAAPGRSLAASLKSSLWNLEQGGQVTAYERQIAGKVADILCGGDVPAGTPVSEQYLLDLEREGFLSLCGEAKTLERIGHLLKTGKPLRN
ncbi:MAG: 3-hydroxyacyl-CoA dehydrogenase [Desulfuromonas sp.]|nr:3-hydroxyacyl-CoA dehydrogenase [Desulfuromonas sp.]